MSENHTNLPTTTVQPTESSNDLNLAELTWPPHDASASATPATSADWDLDALRLDQNFDSLVDAQPVLATVRVRKPRSQEWFRVNSSEAWRLQTAILHLKEEGEAYLVHPTLRGPLWDEIQPVMLFTAVTRQGEPFVWPVRLPKGDGRTDRFMESDMAAVKAAEDKWTRRFWVPEAGLHKILTASQLTDEPVWPDVVSFQALLQVAFKDTYIRDLSHPVVKRLRGEL